MECIYTKNSTSCKKASLDVQDIEGLSCILQRKDRYFFAMQRFFYRWGLFKTQFGRDLS